MVPQFLLAILLLQLLSIFSAAKDFLSNDCPASMCGDLEIKFPYNLQTSSKSCRAAGLNAELSCSSANQTILTLPSSESYRVTAFEYVSMGLTIQLPASYSSSCPWLKGLGGKPPNTTGSIFSNVTTTTFFILNCTNKFRGDGDERVEVVGPISCLSELGSYVYAVPTFARIDILPPHCTTITSVKLFTAYTNKVEQGMLAAYYGFQVEKNMTRPSTMLEQLSLNLNSQGCSNCAQMGRDCGYDSKMESVFCVDLREPRSGIHRLVKGIAIGTATIILIAGLAVLYFIRKFSKEREKRIRMERFLATYKSTTLTRYKYADIKKITKKFKHKLGQGGFGSVYKGELRNGIPVAVKMLQASKSDGEDFINEVSTIGKIHHFNVVRLLGFCSEGKNRALVYEFMPNQSLEKFIFLDDESNKRTELFSTEKLQEIAIGIAQGIDYLHQGCNQRILHFDIKPHNILLDHDFNPKVSDFGLAKLCSREQSIVTISAARGTMGYIAPEVYSRNFGPVSHKSDVYSYGMLLLEMVGRRKNVDPAIENISEIYYPEWIYNKLIHSSISEEMEFNEEIMRKLAVIALWCIQWNPSERPSMTKVVQMLMGNLQSLEMPPRPFVPSSYSSDQQTNGNL